MRSWTTSSSKCPCRPQSSEAMESSGLPSIFIDGFTQLLVGLFLFIALLKGQARLSLLFMLILIMVTGAKIWCRYSLRSIQGSLSMDRRRLFPGEKLTLTAQVENRKALPVWTKVRIPLPSPFGQGILEESRGLFWFQKVAWEWTLTAPCRGCHQIGPLLLGAGDLLGFFHRWREGLPGCHLIVYPRLIPIDDFPAPLRELLGTKGARGPVPDPTSLMGTRDYQHSRPARYIHWKASARHNRLQEKICEPTVQMKVMLLLDVEGFDPDGFEAMLEVVASIAVRLDGEGIPLGFVTNGALAGDGRGILPIGRDSTPAILEALARLENKPIGSSWDCLTRCGPLPWGTTIIYFAHRLDGMPKTPIAAIVQEPGEGPLPSMVFNLDEVRGGGCR